MARSCDWCASTAINRTEDGMIWLCGNPGHDHPFGVIFVPLHWNDPSGRFRSTAKGEMPITISGALSEGQYPKHSLSVDGGNEVPYVQMVDVTEGWKHQPPAPSRSTAITTVPARGWTPSVDADGDLRDGGDVAEVTDLLDLTKLPAGMRVIIRPRGNLDRHGVHFLTAYVAGR